ncbi:MAG: HAD family hydrolase [Desulfovibrionaceae bacterium]|nr:HAD family hydrolase [Desulfovibrionaceae bacterium]
MNSSEEMARRLKRLFPQGLGGIIFDCDGVLLDSGASNTHFYNLARSYFSLPPMNASQEEFVHMHTARQSLEHIIPACLHGHLRDALNSIDYIRDVVPYIRAEPGIYELLEFLQGRGLKLAVHTNRTTFGNELLETFNLKKYFSPIITALTHAPKPSPEGALAVLSEWGESPGKVMFVGDSLLDAQAAENAGLVFGAFKNCNLKAQIHLTGFEEFLMALRKFPGD